MEQNMRTVGYMFERSNEVLMPSVLVIAPNFHYFAQSITQAFAQTGYCATCEVW